jgi:orotate phosphoribosyltransferase-like protein
MILTRCTPCLGANNYLHLLIVVVDDTVDTGTTTKQFLQKIKLIASIHENVLLNVE